MFLARSQQLVFSSVLWNFPDIDRTYNMSMQSDIYCGGGNARLVAHPKFFLPKWINLQENAEERSIKVKAQTS